MKLNKRIVLFSLLLLQSVALHGFDPTTALLGLAAAGLGTFSGQAIKVRFEQVFNDLREIREWIDHGSQSDDPVVKMWVKTGNENWECQELTLQQQEDLRKAGFELEDVYYAYDPSLKKRMLPKGGHKNMTQYDLLSGGPIWKAKKIYPSAGAIVGRINTIETMVEEHSRLLEILIQQSHNMQNSMDTLRKEQQGDRENIRLLDEKIELVNNQIRLTEEEINKVNGQISAIEEAIFKLENSPSHTEQKLDDWTMVEHN